MARGGGHQQLEHAALRPDLAVTQSVTQSSPSRMQPSRQADTCCVSAEKSALRRPPAGGAARQASCRCGVRRTPAAARCVGDVRRGALPLDGVRKVSAACGACGSQRRRRAAAQLLSLPAVARSLRSGLGGVRREKNPTQIWQRGALQRPLLCVMGAGGAWLGREQNVLWDGHRLSECSHEHVGGRVRHEPCPQREVALLPCKDGVFLGSPVLSTQAAREGQARTPVYTMCSTPSPAHQESA